MSTILPLPSDARPKPENDGVDHINVCSHGKTPLGQLATNFAHVPFRHPVHGFFASMEAYWYWVKTGMKHETLRRLYGATAKTAGIQFPIVMMPQEEFVNLMCDGLRCKVMQNAKLLKALKESTLPLRHYFVLNTGGNTVVNEPNRNKWLWRCLEEIRTLLQEDMQIKLNDGTVLFTDLIKEVPENPVPEDMQRYIPRQLEDEDVTRERED